MSLVGERYYEILSVPRVFARRREQAGLWPVARVNYLFQLWGTLKQGKVGALAYFSFGQEGDEQKVQDLDRLLGTFQDYRKHISEEDVYVRAVRPVLTRLAGRIRDVTVWGADGVEEGRVWVSDEKMSVVVGNSRCSVDLGPGREAVLDTIRERADGLAMVVYSGSLGADVVVGSVYLRDLDVPSSVSTVFLPAVEDYVSRVEAEVSSWARATAYPPALRACDCRYDRSEQKEFCVCRSSCGTVLFVLEDEE